ncbi:hypothetical protein BJY52DRAFT_660511 [Lactarius psammicola]|nr:hypothetical protein BJY52DRAFT_660511 [Lactarius psammicola]
MCLLVTKFSSILRSSLPILLKPPRFHMTFSIRLYEQDPWRSIEGTDKQTRPACAHTPFNAQLMEISGSLFLSKSLWPAPIGHFHVTDIDPHNDINRDPRTRADAASGCAAHIFCEDLSRRTRRRHRGPCHKSDSTPVVADLSRCSGQRLREAKSRNGQYLQDASHKTFKYMRLLPLLIPAFDRLSQADMVRVKGRSTLLTIFRGHIGARSRVPYRGNVSPMSGNWDTRDQVGLTCVSSTVQYSASDVASRRSTGYVARTF